MWEVKSFMSQFCCHPQHVFQYVLLHPRKEPEKSVKIIIITTTTKFESFAKKLEVLVDNTHFWA